MFFKVHKRLETITFRETGNNSGLMLIHSTNEVVRYSHIKSTVWPIRKKINERSAIQDNTPCSSLPDKRAARRSGNPIPGTLT